MNVFQSITILVIVQAAVLVGCSSQFEQDALKLKPKPWTLNPVGYADYELLENMNWKGDCSNYAAQVRHDLGATIYRGVRYDGVRHAIACLDDECVDTIYKRSFSLKRQQIGGYWKTLVKK